MKKLELEAAGENKTPTVQTDSHSKAKTPRLPAFIDGKDDLDSYLNRFERFARANKWDEDIWAPSLSALLTGKALDVYSRMSEDAAVDYDQLKEALLKRYDLTEDGYRVKFRDAKPEAGESPEQFIVRLQNYLKRWIELSSTDEDFEGVCNLFVKEQFTDSCPKDLAVHLRERAPADLEELAKVAEQYLIAHGRHLAKPGDVKQQKKTPGNHGNQSGSDSHTQNDRRCYTCGGIGHIASKCPSNHQSTSYSSKKKCYKCDRFGHDPSDCRSPNVKKSSQKAASAIVKKGKTEPKKEVSGGCLVDEKIEDEYASAADIDECIDDGQIMLASGKKVPLVSSACIEPMDEHHSNMPVVKGLINGAEVDVLRDTGCSGVVVKKDFVKEDQYTDKCAYMRLIDNSMRRVPVVKITVNTPYFTGEVEAQCLPDAIYDLIIGNVPGARRPEDPDPDWHEACAVMTRAQAKKQGKFTPLKVLDGTKSATIDKDQLVKMQQEDRTLDRFLDLKEPKLKGQQCVQFQEKGGVLYRLYTHPEVNGGKQLRQVVVPTKLRNHVMETAHDSIMGGHMGIKKTSDKVLSNFYWPGLQGDVTRFVQSCDICQRTVKKGSVPKAALEKMPLIDTPFKRVAVDLIGPIHPPSDEGHRYILTLVDYATRYPDAVPLKTVTTETVAEALVNMYSRLGVPEEVLSDMGSQFVSNCMKEIS